MGKNVRSRIISLAVNRYGASQVAEILGVSRAAISKYSKEKTHPSDDVLIRLLRFSDKKLYTQILGVIGEELLFMLKEYLELVAEVDNVRINNIIKEMIGALNLYIAKSERGR